MKVSPFVKTIGTSILISVLSILIVGWIQKKMERPALPR